MTTAIPFPEINFSTRRQYDIRPIDFQSGKRLAVSADEMKQCECCGRKIVKCFEVVGPRTTLTVGSECEGYLVHPVYRRGRKNRKADLVLAGEAS